MNSFTLYNSDFINVIDNIPKNSIDMVCIDPPYGIVKQEWDVIIPFDILWENIKKVIKDKGVIAIFGTEPFSSLLRVSNLDWFKYDWIWEKNNAGNFQLVNHQPLKIHEIISVFYNETPNMQFANIIKDYMKKLNLKQIDISKLELSKNGNVTGWVTNKLNGSQLPTKEQWEKICKLFNIENKYDEILKTVRYVTYNPDTIPMTEELICSNKNKSGKLGHLSSENKRNNYIQNKTGYPKSILKYNRETEFHPTQKPVKLLEKLIKIYTNENEMVLDFFMGSGTTGVACVNTNRKFIGIEKDKKYFEIAKKRIEYVNNNKEEFKDKKFKPKSKQKDKSIQENKDELKIF